MSFKLDEVEHWLSKCKYDPEAKRSYDLFAGGFSWEDEQPTVDNIEAHIKVSLYLRPIIAYRASLTRGEERSELRSHWDELKKNFPGWPGFMFERIYGNLKSELIFCEQRLFECDQDDT